MEETYNIADLKKKLEELTNKEVHLYDKDTNYSIDLDQTRLEQLVKEAFDLTLQQLAVKNLFKSLLKKYIKRELQISEGKALDDLMSKKKEEINNLYNHFVIVKKLVE